MNKDLSRRKFLERFAAGTATLPLLRNAAQAAPRALPHRVLGRTGASVSILAFGCGSRFLMYAEEDKALEALNRALDLGITYLDTAYAYGDGKSETRVGKVMAVHIHSLGHAEDLAKIEAPDGALKGLLQAREQKMARFIGMTSHTDGAVMVQAIEHHDLDCVQMALNGSRNGRFEELALPAARKKNLGIIAMKVTGQEFLLGSDPGKTDIDSLLRYSLSLPVTTAVIGMPRLEFIEHNTDLARNFAPLGADDVERLRRALAPSREGLEHRLVGHLDGPTECPEAFWA